MPRFLLLLSLLGAATLSAAALTERCPKNFREYQGKCFYQFSYLRYRPHGLAKVITPTQDGFSPKVIHLGKLLFFDPLLSSTRTVSCASCHSPRRSFADNQALSFGVGGKTTRSAPPLWNVAFSPALFWDARAQTLEKQMEGPLFSPSEMGNTPERLVADLKANRTYRALFAEAFGEIPGLPVITLERIEQALATFERTLISLDSPYDRYISGDTTALAPAQERGLQIFRSFVTRCAECHEPPLFTNFQPAVVGAPDLPGLPFDIGMAAWLKDKHLRGAFRVPTLRNIAATAPYLHSGAFPTLNEVVDFYNSGAGRPSSGLSVHWHIRPMGIRVDERDDLVAFLHSLTDISGMPEIPTTLPSGLPLGDHP